MDCAAAAAARAQARRCRSRDTTAAAPCATPCHTAPSARCGGDSAAPVPMLPPPKTPLPPPPSHADLHAEMLVRFLTMGGTGEMVRRDLRALDAGRAALFASLTGSLGGDASGVVLLLPPPHRLLSHNPSPQARLAVQRSERTPTPEAVQAVDAKMAAAREEAERAAAAAAAEKLERARRVERRWKGVAQTAATAVAEGRWAPPQPRASLLRVRLCVVGSDGPGSALTPSPTPRRPAPKPSRTSPSPKQCWRRSSAP